MLLLGALIGKTNMGEHCSSTEFSSAAEILCSCKSRAVPDRKMLLRRKMSIGRNCKKCIANRTKQHGIIVAKQL